MRHLRVVATVALIVAVAMVAVPAPVGSRSPSSFEPPNPDLFSDVEIATAVLGTPTTITPPDPGASSDGTLDQGSTLFEPSERLEPPQARVQAALPQAKAVAESRNPWHFDGDISWYGPGFYGKRTACGYAMTQSLVGVANRTLPCGTLIQFRSNGRTVIAPVVDRGPYVDGRRWDMTAGLCAALDHCYTGSIQWRYAPGT